MIRDVFNSFLQIGPSLKKAIAVSMMALSISPAYADTIFCTSHVGYTGISIEGNVYAHLEAMGIPLLCNVNTPMSTSGGVISVELCKTWVAGFMTAAATGNTVTLGINYPGVAPPCNEIPEFSWVVPTPFPYWFTFNK